jgi:hypothetical protein
LSQTFSHHPSTHPLTDPFYSPSILTSPHPSTSIHRHRPNSAQLEMDAKQCKRETRAHLESAQQYTKLLDEQKKRYEMLRRKAESFAELGMCDWGNGSEAWGLTAMWTCATSLFVSHAFSPLIIYPSLPMVSTATKIRSFFLFLYFDISPSGTSGHPSDPSPHPPPSPPQCRR